MLKEYQFEPASATITVSGWHSDRATLIVVQVVEGVDEKVNFAATRVAYSAFGSVQSLNGKPQTQVTITASGSDSQGDGITNLRIARSHGLALVEETTTGPDGAYRLRGLKVLQTCIIVMKISFRTAGCVVQRSCQSIRVRPCDSIQVFH